MVLVAWKKPTGEKETDIQREEGEMERNPGWYLRPLSHLLISEAQRHHLPFSKLVYFVETNLDLYF